MPQRKKAIKISESDIQTAIVDFLTYDGWRAFRTELTVQRERGRVVGERGMPDYCFIRYLDRHEIHCPCSNGANIIAVLKAPAAEVLWIEFKRLGEKPDVDQLGWHGVERVRGGMVLVVDDIDKFIDFYKRDSGLNRKYTDKR